MSPDTPKCSGMHTLEQLYNNSLALLTDLYQLTMAYAYWKSGTAQKKRCFTLLS